MSDEPVPPRTNRRLTSRTACRLTVRYRAGTEWRGATAMDLSTRGCRLRVGEDLPRGGAVTVAFEGEGAPPVEVQGQVIWCRREGLSYQAGIHFATAPDALEAILIAIP
jgi:PilZ domain